MGARHAADVLRLLGSRMLPKNEQRLIGQIHIDVRGRRKGEDARAFEQVQWTTNRDDYHLPHANLNLLLPPEIS